MTLPDDQLLLRDSVDRFLADNYSFAARQSILAGGSYSPGVWKKFADLGWLGACLPEDCGGYGGGAQEAAIIMEGFGRHLVLEPFVWTTIVGGELLRALDAEIGRPLLDSMVCGELHVALATTERNSGHDPSRIATTARRAGCGWSISGSKVPVPNGAQADRLFVSARTPGLGDGISLFMIERAAPGISFQHFRLHDGQSASRISFDDTLVPASALVGPMGEGLPVLERACDHGIAALCAAAVGSAEHVVAATVAHLKTRRQYGAPLADLQVLQHRLAEMFVAKEQARAMARLAAASLSLPPRQRAREVSAAKVAVTGHVRFVTQQAAQLHGGMGISEELDIAHHLKQATVSAMTFGDEATHLRRFMMFDDD